jgi:mannose-6-phosphate isomerase-like protein (cupin superfamily)
MKLAPILAAAALAIPSIALAQAGSSPEVFSGKDVAAQLTALAQKAKPSGSSGATLCDYKSHSIRLSVRTASGGAEIHAHFDDIFVVTGGSATLITGGTVVDEQTGADGESKGSRIQDGKSQTITKNDIVHIPAGTPHQLIIAPGDTFSSIVVKVRE